MSMLGERRLGATLVEILVAIGLAALLAALGGSALVGVERRQRASRSEGDGRRAVRQAVSVLGEELRGVDSVTVRSDSEIELLTLVGTSVVCDQTSAEIVVPSASAAGGLPYSTWREDAATGDLVAVFDVGSARWWYAVAQRIASASSDACPPATGLSSAIDSVRFRPVRVLLDRRLPASIGVGAPLRVLRRGRYYLSRGTDGRWAMSYRRCPAPDRCLAGQPVTAPLAPRGDGGLSFSLTPDRVALNVTARAPRRANGASGDSVRITMVVGRAP